MQYSVAVRNARLDATETAIGASPVLRTYNGAMPADCAAALAAGNVLLAQGALPVDWLAAAANGTKGKAGTWTATGQAGAGTGTVQTFYRIYDAAGTVCHQQGPIAELGLDNTNVANGQAITINTATYTGANA